MTRLRIILAALLMAGALFAPAAASPHRADSLDAIARDYVRLVLEIGEHDEGYVDAYYGPPAWRAAARAHPRTVPQLAAAAAALEVRAGRIAVRGAARLDRSRRAFLIAQLNAARIRLRMIGGERLSFSDEARGLYGVTPTLRPLTAYNPILARIEQLVPGSGTLADRVDAFQDRFIIPTERLDAVMRAAIAECRRRTMAHILLPAGESFRLEFVTHRNWGGYNSYEGGFRSLIQVNTDLPVRIGRAVDLGCHEGYPGHHVNNLLLERQLARGRGWVEYQVYPLYSPLSFIAEGSANYGIEMAFPGDERLAFETATLYPLAGLPTGDAAAYAALQQAMLDLGGARFTIARDLLERRITRDQAVALAQRYQLVSRARAEQSIAFAEQYRAYVINYGLGRDVVAAFVERAGRSPAARWAAMQRLLSEPVPPGELGPAAS